MKSAVLFPRPGALALLLALASCGGEGGPSSEKEPVPAESAAASAPADPDASAAASAAAATPDGFRALTAEEQQRVLDAIMQAKARQQAEGLGTGRVQVNGAWHYSGYSHLSPDPNAAVEARLVAVDLTVSGHTEHFDYDDIEIVDGATFVSYGSDPQIEPLGPDGRPLAADAAVPFPPATSRWLLIYAFPKDSPRFHLYYWGRQLTPEPLPFEKGGLSLPPPPAPPE